MMKQTLSLLRPIERGRKVIGVQRRMLCKVWVGEWLKNWRRVILEELLGLLTQTTDWLRQIQLHLLLCRQSILRHIVTQSFPLPQTLQVETGAVIHAIQSFLAGQLVGPIICILNNSRISCRLLGMRAPFSPSLWPHFVPWYWKAECWMLCGLSFLVRRWWP